MSTIPGTRHPDLYTIPDTTPADQPIPYTLATQGHTIAEELTRD